MSLCVFVHFFELMRTPQTDSIGLNYTVIIPWSLIYETDSEVTSDKVRQEVHFLKITTQKNQECSLNLPGRRTRT